MKRNKKYLFVGICALVITFISGLALAGSTMTITKSWPMTAPCMQ